MTRRLGLTSFLLLILGGMASRAVAATALAPLASCTDGGCLTLLSWNVHGLPWPISRDPGGRLDAIATAIRSTAPDVVALQEVWLASYEARLERALGAEYQAFFRPRSGIIAGPEGGLVVFLRRAGRWQALTAGLRFVPYQHKANGRLLEGDSISGKGVLRLDVEAAGQAVCLLATHLQAQYPESGPDHLYVAERSGQLEELRAVEQTCGSKPTLLLGDFNTAPEEHGVYDTHMTALGTDLTTRARTECERPCGSHFSADGTRDEWIDYIISPTAGVDAAVQRIVNVAVDRPYSDHDGLLARIVFASAVTPSRGTSP